MADIIPRVFIDDQASGRVNFASDDMKMALFNNVFNDCVLKDIVSYDQIKQYEIPECCGYYTGGLIVSNPTVGYDNNDGSIFYNINDIGMTVSGGTLGPTRYGVIYNTSTGHLVYIFDFQEDKTVNDGANFKIKIDDNGLMKAMQLYECPVEPEL